MKKMDILTPAGFMLAIALILFGSLQGGSSLSLFIDIPSIAITIGGSFAAVLITFSVSDIKRMGKVLKECFSESNIYKLDLVDQFKVIARKIRKDGVLSIEDEVHEIEDEFFKRGLEFIIDGLEPESIKEILEMEIGEVDNEYSKGAKIFKMWSVFAPAFGMIGTLIGLIQMLADLGTPDTIASGMSKALITTFYGALLANVFLIPIGANIDNKGQKQCEYREMMLCGIMSIQNGDSSLVIEEKLINYLSPKEKHQYYSREIDGGEMENVV